MDILLLISGLAVLIEVIFLVILLRLSKRKLPKPEKPKKEERIKEKFSLKKVKPEQYFIFLIYAVVLGFFVYFAMGSLLPKSVVPIDNNFVISAGSLQIFDKLNSFYIDKDNVLGSNETIDNQTVRKVTSAEIFNLIFKPKTIIPDNTNATLKINLVGSGSDVYLNDKPIVPDLTNYELVADLKDEAVYANKNIKDYYNKNSLIQSSNAQDFVYKNFPGASVYSFSDSPAYVPNLEDYKQEWTNISTIIRNNLKLAIYAEGDLSIEFTKQDLDQTAGKDEYTVEVKDQEGKSYYSKKYEDDGDASASNQIGEEQDFEIKLKNLPKEVYYVTFTRDKYNKWEDSTLKNIRVNSNKVLLLGNLMVWSKINFYTELYSPKEISFQTYWKLDNTIKISGDESESIKLKENGEKYPINLTAGEYTISNAFGKFWIFQNPGLSPSKQNWFDIPKQNEGNLNEQSIIIVDKNKLKINGDNISFSDNVVLNKDTKFKLQFIEENKIYLKDIQLNIK